MNFPINVFVYGTLKQGYGNNRLLAASSEFKGAAISENLYLVTGTGFPYAIPNSDTGLQVIGEIWQVNDAETLRNLDSLEGHPHWYCREERTFTMIETNEKIEAWIYEMPDSPEVASRPVAKIDPETNAYIWK